MRGRSSGRGPVHLIAASAVVVLVGIAPPSVAAQQEARAVTPLIRGRLLDEQTRVPVNLVGIHLVRADGTVAASVLSNDEGRFRIVAPAPGSWRLRAERLGYITRETELITLAAADTIDFAFDLAPGPVLLDSMLVTGRREARPLGLTEQLIHGRLLDDRTRLPIREGTIRLIHRNGLSTAITMTDSLGLFRLVAPVPGDYRIRAERIGYVAGESPRLHLMLSDTIRLDFFLDTQAVLLDPILVTASARPWSQRYELRGMEDFFRRMSERRKSSIFLTRDSLRWYDRMGFSTSQMIRDATLRTSAACAGGTAWWLDGSPLVSGVPLDDIWPPAMLEAVEIHVGRPIPAELGTGFLRSPCSAIVLWTVREPRRRAR